MVLSRRIKVVKLTVFRWKGFRETFTWLIYCNSSLLICLTIISRWQTITNWNCLWFLTDLFVCFDFLWDKNRYGCEMVVTSSLCWPRPEWAETHLPYEIIGRGRGHDKWVHSCPQYLRQCNGFPILSSSIYMHLQLKQSFCVGSNAIEWAVQVLSHTCVALLDIQTFLSSPSIHMHDRLFMETAA